MDTVKWEKIQKIVQRISNDYLRKELIVVCVFTCFIILDFGVAVGENKVPFNY